jgi:TRAP transporter TAXI family solute receptor
MSIHKIIRTGTLLVIFSFFSLPVVSAEGRVDNSSSHTLILGSGGISGMYYPSAGAIASFINRGDNGFRLAVVPSARASGENITGLLSGSLDLGLVQSDVQYEAYTGSGNYEKPVPELRTLFSTFTEIFTIVVKDNSDIKSFRDLAGKKISPGTTGSIYQAFIKEYGWRPDELAASNDFRGRELQAIRDGNLDAAFYGYGHPYNLLAEGMRGGGLNIIPVDDAEAAIFLQKYPYFISAFIPANTYEGQHIAVNSFGPKATLLTTTRLSDEAAYLIVKTIVENFDDFTKSHPVFSSLTKTDLITGNTAPFHEGALRYYREVGLLK